MTKKFLVRAAACILAMAALPVAAEPITALARGNTILSFDSSAPGAVNILGTVSGLAAGENLIGIDYRPANGFLYGLSDQSRLYVISLAGVPTAVQVGASGAFTLVGTSFGVDFNPVADRLRVVSDAEQNLRINPNDGTLTATDSPLAFAPPPDPNFGVNPTIVAAAYTNNFAIALGTTLFVLDSTLNILASQNPPNDGTLNTIGGAGNPQLISGFDISGISGVGFANWAAGGGNDALFRIGLGGGATNLGIIGSGQLGILDISVSAVPEPGTIALLGFGAVALGLARRRRLQPRA
jgi:Domain of unknown function (DUF4394)/PEP-CTERM motif